MDDEEETLGERIKRLRDNHGWTQKQLAELVGTTSKTVSNWERDENHPRSSIGALENLFGVSLRPGRSRAGDPVEAAVRGSELIEWRQDAVLSVYKRNLHEQRAEAAS